MRVRVTIELWMWLGKRLDGEFRSPSEMRSVLTTEVEEGTQVKTLFDHLSETYPPIAEKVFDRTVKHFHPNVVVLFNDQVINQAELDQKVLTEGDYVKVVPMYVGG